jgi:hypothetical protein
LKPDHDSPEGDTGRFRTTRWTAVLLSAQSQAPGSPLLDPNNQGALSYEQAASALQVSVGSVKTLIHRLRKQYASLLREEVARTVCEPREIDEEIHCLCEALISAEGRLGT